MIGYSFTSRNYWGGLYNREIKHLLLTHIYQWVDTAYFTVGAENVRSRKAMTKIGGVLLTREQINERKLDIAAESVLF
jgi:RimJ/RimL family protein N-acetyltransferase